MGCGLFLMRAYFIAGLQKARLYLVSEELELWKEKVCNVAWWTQGLVEV